MKRTELAVLCSIALTSMAAGAGEIRVLCTTFPLHQITRNVTQGREGIAVQLLLPANLGCPHHYSLSPQDMRKLAAANVLVVNGLGLEEFLGAPIKKANPGLRILDSSSGITNLLPYAQAATHHGHAHPHGHAHDDPPDADASALNPHLFASPRLAATLALNIAAGLAQADPAGAEIYTRNAKAHAGRMNTLADEMTTLVKTLRNNRIVQPHGAFDYLARDIGLEIVATTQPHGQEPSAAEMLALVKVIRQKKAGAIVSEPQYSPKVGQTLAREAGIPAITLDPVASGPENAPLDYYEKVMRMNMDALLKVLGARPE